MAIVFLRMERRRRLSRLWHLKHIKTAPRIPVDLATFLDIPIPSNLEEYKSMFGNTAATAFQSRDIPKFKGDELDGDELDGDELDGDKLKSDNGKGKDAKPKPSQKRKADLVCESKGEGHKPNKGKVDEGDEGTGDKPDSEGKGNNGDEGNKRKSADKCY